MLPAIAWKKNKVVMIDQRKLPLKEIYLEYRRYGQVARAIETMVIRGAPAIGVAAAYGVALGVLALRGAAKTSTAPLKGSPGVSSGRGPRPETSSGRWRGCEGRSTRTAI